VVYFKVQKDKKTLHNQNSKKPVISVTHCSLPCNFHTHTTLDICKQPKTVYKLCQQVKTEKSLFLNYLMEEFTTYYIA